MEGPEYNADAAHVKERSPELPLVVKMHPMLSLAPQQGEAVAVLLL
jgi:hypothetical protein